MARILIVDDEVPVCNLFTISLEERGHTVNACHAIAEVLTRVTEFAPDVVLLDVILPDGNGLDILPQIRAAAAAPEVILFTGHADIEAAELAIRRGAWAYLVKNTRLEQILDTISSALQFRSERRPILSRGVLRTDGIVGSSPALMECISLVSKASMSDVNVLICGETGTGKELFARAIHANSRRRDKNFVVVDCAALPETLVESILFGHAKGSFTGADSAREGLVKQANGGTLFLDEIGDMPLPIQKPFLRVLQERRFRPVGAESEVESDFRLLSATHRDLGQLVKQGRFREDLLFRIRGLTLALPPLRERPGDIQELLAFHMKRICERHGLPSKAITIEFIDFLNLYPWPGNVRELVQATEAALIAAQDCGSLFPHHLPSEIRIEVFRHSTSERIAEQNPVRIEPVYTSGTLKDVREEAAEAAERRLLQETVEATRGDIPEACARLGLSKSRLYALLRKHNLSTHS